MESGLLLKHTHTYVFILNGRMCLMKTTIKTVVQVHSTPFVYAYVASFGAANSILYLSLQEKERVKQLLPLFKLFFQTNIAYLLVVYLGRM